MKKALISLLIVIMLLTMSACTKKNKSESVSVSDKNVNIESVDDMIIGGADSRQSIILANDKRTPLEHVPVITYEDNKIYINGDYYATSERLYVYRLDERVISFATDQGLVNLNADGTKISLKDIVINRAYYEATIENMMLMELAVKNTDMYHKYYDYSSVKEEKMPYDEAMKLDFFLDYRGVSIIFPDESSGMSLSVTYGYDSPLFNPDYLPSEGITCYNDMTGRVGYSVPALKLEEEYADHWAESALEICNFEGENYIWYCISYKDEDDNKVYYSSIVKEHEDSEDEVIYSRKVEGPFICCDILKFAKIMQNKDAKRPSREYFENLDKESSLEDIVKEIGNYGLAGSGIIYHVWKLDDGSEARVTFDSQERIVRIYIHDKENSELIYDRYE
ncbi:MAG: hypothetical protein IK014_11250 [Lachnospiraceae bacterium]|nr:hypothetical protein [Lachnospiraceae bacterium]